jgi:sensor histidine kinase regulating citrate/malate metabolism
MIKNALEAISEEERVSVSCRTENKHVSVAVHNPGQMPDPVQKQVFQRSFTTKGKGRGLGTYSMKLLGERYLGGKVGFSSAGDTGTIFTLSLPV